MLSQHHTKLLDFINIYCKITRIVGPLLDANVVKIYISNFKVCSVFVMTYVDKCLCIDGFNIWVVQTIISMEENVVVSNYYCHEDVCTNNKWHSWGYCGARLGQQFHLWIDIHVTSLAC